MSKLLEVDKEHCQVVKYKPFTLGGSVYHECGNKPRWVIHETVSGKDGLKGSQSCCEEYRQEWANKTGNPNVDNSWKWENISEV